jgi:hypothetical protein
MILVRSVRQSSVVNATFSQCGFQFDLIDYLSSPFLAGRECFYAINVGVYPRNFGDMSAFGYGD